MAAFLLKVSRKVQYVCCSYIYCSQAGVLPRQTRKPDERWWKFAIAQMPAYWSMYNVCVCLFVCVQYDYGYRSGLTMCTVQSQLKKKGYNGVIELTVAAVVPPFSDKWQYYTRIFERWYTHKPAGLLSARTSTEGCFILDLSYPSRNCKKNNTRRYNCTCCKTRLLLYCYFAVIGRAPCRAS